jgi:hypothetical protein
MLVHIHKLFSNSKIKKINLMLSIPVKCIMYHTQQTNKYFKSLSMRSKAHGFLHRPIACLVHNDSKTVENFKL